MVGPTAVGKTAVVVELASRIPLSVLSADSRQVYRQLNIGTAKPDAATLAVVPHAGIDLVDPGTRFSAGDFVRAAAEWLRDRPADCQPLVVGGTGLYVKALTEGLFREPDLDPDARGRLERWAAGHGDMQRWASRLDPGFAGGGKQRAIRAVEIALLTGRSLSWWQRERPGQGLVRPWYVRLVLPREVLYDRIRLRVLQMLETGWVDEVRGILTRGFSADAAGLDGVGYREIVQHLGGRIALGELPDVIARQTRRYAKRQETWFSRQLAGHPVKIFDATLSPGEIADAIVAMWREETH